MGVEGGRFEVYGMCGVEVPIVPEEVKRKRTLTPKINLTKEGELQEGMYTGLKLGQSMESEELRLMDEDVGKPKPSFVPSQILPTPKNVPPPQTPNWNAEMLDSRGVELGKVTSWARAQAEISKNNPKVENGSLMVGGRLVRNRNLAFFLGFPVGPALAFGRAGGDNMVGLIGEGAETLRLIGYIITAGWVGVCVLGFKEDGVRGAVFGPGK